MTALVMALKVFKHNLLINVIVIVSLVGVFLTFGRMSKTLTALDEYQDAMFKNVVSVNTAYTDSIEVPMQMLLYDKSDEEKLIDISDTNKVGAILFWKDMCFMTPDTLNLFYDYDRGTDILDHSIIAGVKTGLDLGEYYEGDWSVSAIVDIPGPLESAVIGNLETFWEDHPMYDHKATIQMFTIAGGTYKVGHIAEGMKTYFSVSANKMLPILSVLIVVIAGISIVAFILLWRGLAEDFTALARMHADNLLVMNIALWQFLILIGITFAVCAFISPRLEIDVAQMLEDFYSIIGTILIGPFVSIALLLFKVSSERRKS